MNAPNWTKEELIAYILLYAAHSNTDEDNHERNVIISKVDMQTFQRIHDEFDADNDYQSIQKIIKGIEAHHYSKTDLNSLLSDLKLLFLSDGKFDTVERQVYQLIKKLLG